MTRGVQRSLLLGALSSTLAGGGGPASPTPLVGAWGGDHISLTVTQAGSHVEFDCAHGDMPSLLAAADGAFEVKGTYVREHGGPIGIAEVPDTHPADYVGSAGASTMVLTVRLIDSGEAVGTFTLTRGSPGRVLKCLAAGTASAARTRQSSRPQWPDPGRNRTSGGDRPSRWRMAEDCERAIWI
jgi:hypothetical protein